MLNIFRVNLDKIGIPESVYIYDVSFKTTEERKRVMCYKRLENIFGFVDWRVGKLYSYKRVDYLPKDLEMYLELEFQEEKCLEDLDQFIRNKIIEIYIKNVVKKDVKRKLRSLEAELLKGRRKIGKWKLYLTLEGDRVEVLRINDQFYVTFNIKLRIIGNKNLWDWIGRDIRILEKLCWTPDSLKDIKIWFRYAPDIKTENEQNYLLVGVMSKDEVKRTGFTFEELRDYPIEKRGLTQEELKKLAKFNDFDENQPIIRGCADLKLKSCYSFLPQYCIPAYNVVLASEEENKEIWKIRDEINFRKKAKIISSILEQLPYLEYADDTIEFKNLDDVKLKAKFVKVQLTLDGKNRVIPTIISKPYEKYISNTADLFRWTNTYWLLKSGKIKQAEVEIPIPDYIPECLKDINELETFLLIEEGLDRIEEDTYRQLLYSTVEAYNIMLEVYKQIRETRIPRLNFRGKRFSFENSEEGVEKIIKKICETFQGKLGFALIFGKSREFNEDNEENEGYYDYYVPLKAKLFNNDILSQNFVVDNYIDDKGRIDNKKIGFALSNIVYDIFGKLGIKFFVLEESIPYDYILGIDVGYGEAYTGKVAGCTTIHDSEGRLRNIIPVSKENLPDRESARIKALLEYIESKYRIYRIDFDNKKILILRDGFVQQEEIEQLKEFSRKKKCKIVVIGVRKSVMYQILSKNVKPCYVKVGESYLLKAHEPRVGYPRPIKIVQKVVIDWENVKNEKPTEEDVLLVYKLTALNYSTIGKSSNLRIPSPVYYADKLVKALKRGWKLREDFLKDGLLYFI